MSANTILVIEDDKDITELIKYNLEREGFFVINEYRGNAGYQLATKTNPSIIILDLMLPELDGLTICKKLKANNTTASIPIIMLTAKSDESDIIVGLELGADDYICKPFSVKVLLARVKSIFRRINQNEEIAKNGVIKFHNIYIDCQRRIVKIEDEKIDLTDTEFKLLALLTSNPGIVFCRQKIIDKVRGYDAAVTDRAVDVQVLGLRKKLGEAGKFIETVRGVGYRLTDE